MCWKILGGGGDQNPFIIGGSPKAIVERAHDEGYSNSFMMDLAGNCFASTIPAAIDLAILANLTESHVNLLQKQKKPRKKQTTDPTFDAAEVAAELDDVMEMMGFMETMG